MNCFFGFFARFPDVAFVAIFLAVFFGETGFLAGIVEKCWATSAANWRSVICQPSKLMVELDRLDVFGTRAFLALGFRVGHVLAFT